MSLRSLVFRPASARELQLWPEPSPNQNVQVTDLPGERSPVSAVRKAHGFRAPQRSFRFGRHPPAIGGNASSTVSTSGRKSGGMSSGSRRYGEADWRENTCCGIALLHGPCMPDRFILLSVVLDQNDVII
jgi:hypothetical protein